MWPKISLLPVWPRDAIGHPRFRFCETVSPHRPPVPKPAALWVIVLPVLWVIVLPVCSGAPAARAVGTRKRPLRVCAGTAQISGP